MKSNWNTLLLWRIDSSSKLFCFVCYFKVSEREIVVHGRERLVQFVHDEQLVEQQHSSQILNAHHSKLVQFVIERVHVHIVRTVWLDTIETFLVGQRFGHGSRRRVANHKHRPQCVGKHDQKGDQNTRGHQRAHTHRAKARAQLENTQTPFLYSDQSRNVFERRGAQLALSQSRRNPRITL